MKKSILMVTLIFVLISNAQAITGIFVKTAYEEFYRYHDFENWLSVGEKLSTQEVKCYTKIGGTDSTSSMISDTSINSDTRVIYRVKAGTANVTYVLKIKAVTSTGQKFEDWVEMKVI